MGELEDPPPDALFEPPERLFLATQASVDDPRAVDPSASALGDLAEFAVVPSNRSTWTRTIEGELVDEFIAASGPGRRGVLPDQAWIALPGYRTGTEEPVAAVLTCFRPVIDGLDPVYGITIP
jgi:hypothetical protein